MFNKSYFTNDFGKHQAELGKDGRFVPAHLILYGGKRYLIDKVMEAGDDYVTLSIFPPELD